MHRRSNSVLVMLAVLLINVAPVRAGHIPVRTIHTEHASSVMARLSRFANRFKPHPLKGRLARFGRRVWRSHLGWLCRTLHRDKADLIVVSDLHLGQGHLPDNAGLDDFTVDRSSTVNATSPSPAWPTCCSPSRSRVARSGCGARRPTTWSPRW